MDIQKQFGFGIYSDDFTPENEENEGRW